MLEDAVGIHSKPLGKMVHANIMGQAHVQPVACVS
jgi:hypothetical protein